MPLATTVASQCAAPFNTTLSELEVAQLHANAESALSVALYHLRQPTVNVPGAARKAVQALAALNKLRHVIVARSSSTQAPLDLERSHHG